ncbi:MAG: Zn-dependent aminopeptidase, partial [Chitinophagaceae bacterium]|nr:Zn-dependent aminopeptidase [Chitinophagaceae bacterium]
YFKGAVFLEQLGYIVGAKVRDSILLEYYKHWKFRHPRPDDFIRLAEKVSGIELDWYKEYWINSTKAIDYSISNLVYENGKTKITLKRLGKMPMPIDVVLTFKDGTQEMHYIPLDLMYGNKQPEKGTVVMHSSWKWTHPEYTFESSRDLKDLKKAEIDPSGRMADIDRRALVIPD